MRSKVNFKMMTKNIDRNFFDCAPSWATYIARDPNDEWYFYEYLPTRHHSTGIWELERPYKIRKFSDENYFLMNNATDDIYRIFYTQMNTPIDVINEPDPIAEYLDAASWLKPSSEIVNIF